MPVHSKKQYNLFQMIANGKKPDKSKGIGPSKEVAEEMISKTSKSARSKFAKSK